jgi:hypothetical protein
MAVSFSAFYLPNAVFSIANAHADDFLVGGVQRLLADVGDVSGVFFPSLRQALKPAGIIVRGGQGFQELLHVAEPTPARGRCRNRG